MSKLISLAVFLLLASLTQPVIGAEIDDYQRSYDMYRQSYSIFNIKKADYFQAGTFAAEEALVKAAGEMLLFRADTWSNYWKTVAGSYAGVGGATETEKSEWKSFFDSEIGWLGKHKDSLITIKDRQELLEETTLLNGRNQIYLSKAFEMNVLISYGKLTDAIDQLKNLNHSLLERVKNQKIDVGKQEAAIRGLENNLEKLDQVWADMSIVRQDLIGESNYVGIDQFEDIGIDLLPYYQQMVQVMSVTRELAKDIQW